MTVEAFKRLQDIPVDENFLENGVYLINRVYTIVEQYEDFFTDDSFRLAVCENYQNKNSLNFFFAEFLEQIELTPENL